MKKLITVAWSRTIEIDVPENVTLDDLNSPGKEGEYLYDLQTNILKSAADDVEVSWKSGEITDVQDLEKFDADFSGFEKGVTGDQEL